MITPDSHDKSRSIGALLRMHRAKSGLSQRQLAERSGLGVRTIRDIERDAVWQPRERSLAALISALGLSSEQLLDLRCAIDESVSSRASAVGVLGQFSLTRHGFPVEIASSTRRNLLALLALHAGQPVSQDEIVDVLWGEQPPKSAATIVHMQVAGLRKVLEPQAIDFVRGRGYALDEERVRIDLRDFTRLRRQGEGAARSGDPQTALRHYESALRCWRGPVLAGAATQLRQHRIATDVALLRAKVAVAYGDLALELNLPESAVALLRQVVADEPVHEGLHARLMSALAGGGESAAALRLFAELRDRLREELGTEPGPEPQAAHLRILRGGTPVAVDTGAFQGVPAHPHRPAQLPTDTRVFVGRKTQLRRLDAVLRLVASGKSGVVVISGTAGAGKTALAVHWGHHNANRFPDGQLYVNLRGFEPTGAAMPVGDAIRALLDPFNLPAWRIPADPTAQIGLYRSVLAQRRILVVLDNARDSDQVRPLLPGSSSCMTVVTSRDDLSGLVAVEGATPVSLGAFSVAEARALMSGRIGASRVASEPHATEEIIARCARLPLALAVVSARAVLGPGLSLSAIATALRTSSGLDMLADVDASADLRRVFSPSYQSLSPAAARLFRLLGVHPGPDVDAGAAASLAGMSNTDSRTCLDELHRRHLIEIPTPKRYAMHDLLRAYASELANAAKGETHEAMTRVLDHYLHAAAAAEQWLHPHRDRFALAEAAPGVVIPVIPDAGHAQEWFRSESAVLISAVKCAAERGFDRHAWQIAWAIATYLDRSGRWDSYAATQELALAAARASGDLRGETQASRLLGLAHSRLGDYEKALSCMQQSLELSRRLGDDTGQGHTNMNMARVFGRLGEYPRALSHAQEAQARFGSAGHRYGQANALNAIGWYLAQLGDYAAALRSCQSALPLHRAIGDRQGEAATLDSVGYAHHHLGSQDRAIACYEQAVRLYREVGDRYFEADTLIHLGEAHDTLGETGGARAAWHGALAILEDLAHPDAGPLRKRLESAVAP